jgi:hypothetical protein
VTVRRDDDFCISHKTQFAISLVTTKLFKNLFDHIKCLAYRISTKLLFATYHKFVLYHNQNHRLCCTIGSDIHHKSPYLNNIYSTKPLIFFNNYLNFIIIFTHKSNILNNFQLNKNVFNLILHNFNFN